MTQPGSKQGIALAAPINRQRSSGRRATVWLEWNRAGVRSRLPLNRPLTIGRDPSCDVRLPEPTVSRRHALVSIVGGRPLVDASMSMNGISLDCGRANHAALGIGQTFAIGATVFRLVGGPAAVAQATPSTAQSLVLAAQGQPAMARRAVAPPGRVVHSGRNARTPGQRPPLFAAVGAVCLILALAAVFVVTMASGTGLSGGTGGVTSTQGTALVQAVGSASDSPLAVPSANASAMRETASTPAIAQSPTNAPASRSSANQVPPAAETPAAPSTGPVESLNTAVDKSPVPPPTNPGPTLGPPDETPVPPPAAPSTVRNHAGGQTTG